MFSSGYIGFLVKELSRDTTYLKQKETKWGKENQKSLLFRESRLKSVGMVEGRGWFRRNQVKRTPDAKTELN